jgi:hypothetical protein
MHRQTFPAFDTASGGVILAVNHPTAAYTEVTDLADVLVDSTGTTMSNKYFSFTFIGVQNKTGEFSPILMNLPDGAYSSQSDAESDVSGHDVFTIPREFNLESSTGFLICRVTLRHQPAGSGTWSYVSTTDLRGANPITAGSGTGGSAVTDFSDANFSIFNSTDPTKIVAVDASGVTTATTRTLTVPDADITIGDVTGPGSSTDNGIARFDGTTGKLIQNSTNATVADDGTVTGVNYTFSDTLSNLGDFIVDSVAGTVYIAGTQQTDIDMGGNDLDDVGTVKGVAGASGSDVTVEGGTPTATNGAGVIIQGTDAFASGGGNGGSITIGPPGAPDGLGTRGTITIDNGTAANAISLKGTINDSNASINGGTVATPGTNFILKGATAPVTTSDVASREMAIDTTNQVLYVRGTSMIPVHQTIFRSTTTTEIVSSTAYTTIFSATIPADILETDRGLNVKIPLDYLNDTGATKTYKLKVTLGGTTIYEDQANANLNSNSNRGGGKLDLTLENYGATNSQLLHGTMLFVLGGSAVTTGIGGLYQTQRGGFPIATAAKDSTGDLAMVIQFAWTTSSASLSLRAYGYRGTLI